jgi:predicted GNAT family acetyltransferase
VGLTEAGQDIEGDGDEKAQSRGRLGKLGIGPACFSALQIIGNGELCGMEMTHDRAAGLFSLGTPAGNAVLEYGIEGGTMVVTHTYVPPGLRGRGMAEKLVRAALAFAREEGLAVMPRCGYVAAFLKKHPDLAPPA